ncbi:MAG: prolyl oligopeptidase family serine peptidase, partial [Proteobacteria bacterium]|nr:prolyl oligopeptidase family serine peptidase [Pseudomonadota bacterium]
LTAILNAQLDQHSSPFLDATNLQKPVLLMHSHYDMRVPLDHSLRFYRAARNAGKDNLVSLWIDEQESRHAPIIPTTGTLKQAKSRVNREVKIIEKFADTKQFSNSDSSYERWMHAYPKNNNADSLANGLNPIKEDNRNEFYRSAIKELSATSIAERNIDAYVNNKLASKPLDYLLMYNFLMQKTGETNEEVIANSWDGKKFKEKFCSNFPGLNEISKNIDSYLSNNPFVTNLPAVLGKKLVFCRKMLDQDHTKEYSEEVAYALLETYINDFYTFFGKSSASELRQELEKLTRDKMLAETPAIIANLKKIFPD